MARWTTGLLAAGLLASTATAGGQNGGADCAVCTLMVGLVEQNMQLKQLSAKDSMLQLCGYLPGKIADDVCGLAVDEVGKKVIPLIEAGKTADEVCHAVGTCKVQTGVCHLFPKKKAAGAFEAGLRQLAADAPARSAAAAATMLGKSNIMSWVCKIVPGVCEVEDHKPFSDKDDDYFSTKTTLRGSDWRGKDCDDKNAKVFPGVLSSDSASGDAAQDTNCNGISGVNPATQKSYEHELCDGTNAMGIASLGDSATAHFRIPADYLTASKLSKDVFAHIVRNLENELDWPMLSWSTGHLNASQFEPDVSGPMSSIYSRMAEHNRCNHRDYQNIGVNGAKVNSLAAFENDLGRNTSWPVKQKPIVVVMSMVGNDVCNRDHNEGRMTEPKVYREQVIAGLKQADIGLPAGSKVLLVPLVDGRILYDTMHDRIHPIGETNQDVTYTALYDYLNCLDISPCWGWMNSNATVRNDTWVRAKALGEQLPIIANTTKGMFKNIEVVYKGNLYDEGLQSYQGPKWHLIEPVDGFHPSQIANTLLGNYIYENGVEDLMGPRNPNNAKIQQLFGDQGGF